MRWAAVVLAVIAVVCLGGCVSPRGLERPFEPGQDTFAFSNQLRWHYEFAEPGEVRTREVLPKPEYSLRCFPLARAAREFFYHSEFRPDLPRVSGDEYLKLARKVIRRNSRSASPPEERIIIPGFEDLHAFSADFPELLKAECGGPVSSFLQRGNWRMIFPVSGARHRKTAANLMARLRNGEVPIVHIYRFPDTSLNHALLIYSAEESAGEIAFKAYDPNDPTRPAALMFDRATDTFRFERNRYFAGGAVRVYEVYRGLFY